MHFPPYLFDIHLQVTLTFDLFKRSILIMSSVALSMFSFTHSGFLTLIGITKFRPDHPNDAVQGQGLKDKWM